MTDETKQEQKKEEVPATSGTTPAASEDKMEVEKPKAAKAKLDVNSSEVELAQKLAETQKQLAARNQQMAAFEEWQKKQQAEKEAAAKEQQEKIRKAVEDSVKEFEMVHSTPIPEEHKDTLMKGLDELASAPENVQQAFHTWRKMVACNSKTNLELQKAQQEVAKRMHELENKTRKEAFLEEYYKYQNAGPPPAKTNTTPSSASRSAPTSAPAKSSGPTGIASTADAFSDLFGKSKQEQKKEEVKAPVASVPDAPLKPVNTPASNVSAYFDFKMRSGHVPSQVELQRQMWRNPQAVVTRCSKRYGGALKCTPSTEGRAPVFDTTTLECLLDGKQVTLRASKKYANTVGMGDLAPKMHDCMVNTIREMCANGGGCQIDSMNSALAKQHRDYVAAGGMYEGLPRRSRVR